MNGLNKLDLERHFALTTSPTVSKIITPLTKLFYIKHFRYLKLYNNGSRIILSNNPDCTRFLYELGHYKKMWFDGEYPEQLTEGWHILEVMRTINCEGEVTPFEKEINKLLGVFHGITYIEKSVGYYEIYTFDTNHADIYSIDNKLLKQFIVYFKEQARKLIEQGEQEKIIIRLKQPLLEPDPYSHREKFSSFLEQTRVNRYYLGGKYRDVFLTAKEAQCAYWLIQGKSAEEIAMIESTSAKTTLFHLENIRRKLTCSKQTQIVRILLEMGFLEIYNYL